VASDVVKKGDFLLELNSYDFGIALTSGPKSYDVVWMGGSTTRYRQGERDVRVVPADEVDAHSRDHLLREAEAARRERRAGAKVRRGTISPWGRRQETSRDHRDGVVSGRLSVSRWTRHRLSH
jgi:hypothetical protein